MGPVVQLSPLGKKLFVLILVLIVIHLIVWNIGRDEPLKGDVYDLS